MISKHKNIALVLLLILLNSCSIQFQVNTELDIDSEENGIKIIVENTKQKDKLCKSLEKTT